MKNKLIIIVSFFVLILLLVLFAIFILVPKKTNNKTFIKKENITLPSSSEEQIIAKSIISWLDEQKDDRGIYYSIRSCTVENNCGDVGESNRTGFAAVWARYRYYLATKDNSQLDIIKKDLISIKNMVDSGKYKIQNNHYACYFMSDIYFDQNLSQEIKDLSKEVCLLGTYEITNNPFESELYLQNRDKELPNASLNQENSNLIQQSSISKIDNFLNNKEQLVENSDIYTKYAYHASDLIARNIITSNPKYLNSAIFVFDIILDNYINSYDKLSVEERLSISTASLDFYRITDNQLFFDFAKTVFEKEKPNIYYNLNSVIQYRISAEALAQITKDKKYIENRKSVYDFVIKNYYQSIASEDNKFYRGSVYNSGSTSITMEILQNALFTAIISQQ